MMNHIYIQTFNYWVHSPKRDNMREWASQALKNGADYKRTNSTFPE